MKADYIDLLYLHMRTNHCVVQQAYISGTRRRLLTVFDVEAQTDSNGKLRESLRG